MTGVGRAFVVALVVALAGCGGTTSIPSFVEEATPDGSSGTLVAARGEKMVHCEGFGLADREEKVAADCDTVYDLMSMTKQFTAAAILKLQMQGELEVTDQIGEYVGPVPAAKRGITIRHLLTHTSGLVDVLGGDYEPLARDEMVDAALGSELREPPGDEYHYSNVGYSLLAAIIEKASGLGYEEYLAKHVFAPAGMTQTGYTLPTWRQSRVAVEYDAAGQPHGTPFDHPWAADGPHWNLRGNGGMLSTARDMFRWHRALQGDTVLDDEARKELFEPRVREEPGGDTFAAYGWVVQETDEGTVLWHNGGNDWSYGEIARESDNGVLVFWVTNQAKSDAGDWDFYELGADLTDGVLEHLRTGAS